MKKLLIKIFNHFGPTEQMLKFEEEAHEAIKAVFEGNRDRVVDEFADLSNLMDQWRIHYKIDPSEILRRKEFKINRTLQRINDRYYENNTVDKGADV